MENNKDNVVDEVAKKVEKTLKDNFIKNMIQGSEIAYTQILNYINDGHNIDEVKLFIEKMLKKRNKIIKITTKE